MKLHPLQFKVQSSRFKVQKLSTFNFQLSILLLLIINSSFLIINCASAQTKLSTTSPAPGTAVPAAILELESTNRGLLMPRVTDNTAIGAPVKGLVIYNTTKDSLQYYTGSKWITMGAGGMGIGGGILPGDADGDGIPNATDPYPNNPCFPAYTFSSATATPSTISGACAIPGESTATIIANGGATIKNISIDTGKTIIAGNGVTVMPSAYGVNNYSILVNNCPTNFKPVTITLDGSGDCDNDGTANNTESSAANARNACSPAITLSSLSTTAAYVAMPFTLTATAGSGSIKNVQLSTDNGISYPISNASNSLTYTPSAAGTFTYWIRANNCASATKSTSINVGTCAAPITGIISPASVYAGVPVTYTLSGSNITSLDMSLSPGFTSIKTASTATTITSTPVMNAVGSVTYVFRANNNTCSDYAKTFTVACPAAPSLSVDKGTSGVQANIPIVITGTGANITSLQWNITGSTSSYNNAGDNTIEAPSAPTATTTTYYVRANNCSGNSSITINTVNAPSPPANTTKCTGCGPSGVDIWVSNTDDGGGTPMVWSTGSFPVTAVSSSDGRVNQLDANSRGNANFPAFKTCADKGSGWYLPSTSELMNMCSSKNGLNSAGTGFTMFKTDSYYWSSTENGNGLWHVLFLQCYEYYYNAARSNNEYVRCVWRN